MSMTDIKRDIMSEKLVNFLFCHITIPISMLKFHEISHARSLTLVIQSTGLMKPLSARKLAG